MTIFSGDEIYPDEVTSGPWDHTVVPSIDGPTFAVHDDDDWSELDDDDLSGEFSDVAQGRWDYD